MASVLKIVCLACLLTCLFETALCQGNKYYLMDQLLTNYGKNVADRDEGQSLNLDVRPIKVVNVDVENGIVQLDLWLTYSWVDSRLLWDPSEFEVDKLYIKSSDIYIPDVVPYYGYATDLLVDPEVIVYYDGRIYFVRPIRAEMYCNLPDIPFNRKLCNMTLGSWSKDTSTLNLTTTDDEVDMTSFGKKIGTCRIPSASKKIETKVYSCCPESYTSMLVIFHIKCQTKSKPSVGQALGYHDDEMADLTNTRGRGGDLGVALEKCPLPLVAAPFMILLVFFLPPRANDRVFLGAIVFLYLLLMWTSGVLTTDEYISFHQLSIGVTITATFFSLVSCKINGTSTYDGSANDELNEAKRRWCKKRLASMLDMMMFAAAAMVLGVATAGLLA